MAVTKAAYGAGIATVTADGTVLDAWYPAPVLGVPADIDPGTSRLGELELTGETSPELGGLVEINETRGVEIIAIRTVLPDLAAPPRDAYDVYLRLHLLSHRLIAPHGCSMDGVFGLLTNVVWTNHGPCSVAHFEQTRVRLRAALGPVTVFGIDKFPRMTDYVVPPGVRIADADRVRLGAHLAAGTTVMHEGFVNYNAGTLGASMVEGRISAGVVVGDGSDIGGGASIMGTLSGGGTAVVRIGTGCLVGANAGIGISLGNDCVVEAGCYITAGSKLTLPDGAVVKAAELSGRDGLLFRRNSLTGGLEALPRSGTWTGLNADLHAN